MRKNYLCNNCHSSILVNQRKCRKCGEKLIWDNSENNKKSSFWSWALALNLLILGFLRFITSVIFRIIGGIDGSGLIDIVKEYIYMLLGLLSLLGLPGTVVGIILLVKRKKHKH